MRTLGLILLAPIACAFALGALALGACHVLATHDLDDDTDYWGTP